MLLTSSYPNFDIVSIIYFYYGCFTPSKKISVNILPVSLIGGENWSMWWETAAITDEQLSHNVVSSTLFGVR